MIASELILSLVLWRSQLCCSHTACQMAGEATVKLLLCLSTCLQHAALNWDKTNRLQQSGYKYPVVFAQIQFDHPGTPGNNY